MKAHPTNKKSTGAKPWSREWLKEKLCKPYILFPLLALILIPILIFLFWPKGGGDPDQPLAVQIKSVPTGASIFLDGKAQENPTDAKLNLKPGKYQLKLELKEHKVIEKEIVIAENSHGPFHFHLQKIPKKITPITPPPPPETRLVKINTIPEGATVFLNGDEQKAKTPAELSLKPGTYKLELTLSDYQTRSETLEVVSGKEPLVKEYPLEPLPPALEIVQIKTTPRDAELFLDGKRLPVSPDGKYKFSPGKHVLEAKRDETHQPLKKAVVIKKDQPNPEIVMDLSPIVQTIAITWKGDPKNVKLFINGELTKLVKDGKYKLPVGKHTLKVQNEEDQFIRTVEIKKGQDLAEVFDLSPPVEIVTITTVPDGAKIIINGKEAKPLPNNKNKFKVPVGKHDIHVILDKAHEEKKDTINVVKGGKNVFPFELPAIIFPVSVESNPTGAEVYVDGVPEKAKTPGLFKLKPGKHMLVLKSEGFKDFTQEIEIVAGKEPKPVVAKLIPLDTKKFALLVGVGNPTRELPHFLHAASDIDALAETLRAGGYPKDQVTVLKSSPENGPTAENIRTQLAKIVKQATIVDSVVVVLIGHQVQFNGSKETYFCPLNSQLTNKATLLPMSEIYEALSKCKAQMKLLVRDTWRHPWFNGTMPPPGVKINLARSAEKAPPGVILLSSCLPDRQGYIHDQYRHGAFTYFLLRALQGDADRDNDQHISLEEAYQYVNTHLPKFTQEKYSTIQKADLENGNALVKAKLTEVGKGLALLNKGRNQLLDKNNNQAVQTLGEAAKLLPDMVSIYNVRAEAHENIGDYNQMLEDVAKALQFNPASATAYSLKGNAHFHLNQYDPSLQSFTDAIKLDPQFGPEYISRGIIYHQKGDFDKAVGEYTEALRYKPGNVLALQNRGHSYLKLKKLDEAIADYSDALKIDAGNAELYNYRGVAQRQKGNYQDAIDDYTRAIKINDKNSAYWHNRGQAYVYASKYDEALSDFTQAINLNPTFKDSWFNRGVCHTLLKKMDEAIKDFTRVTELDDKDAPAWNQLGLSYEKVKNYDKAIESHSKAIKLSPMPKYWLHRGNAYFLKKSYPDALADYTKVIDDPAMNGQATQYRIMALQNRIQLWKILEQPGKAQEDQKKLKELQGK